MHDISDTSPLDKHLRGLGIGSPSAVHHNLSPAALYELAIKRGEVHLSEDGALIAMTGQHTGRSPNDKYIVRDALTEKDVNFGNVNQPYEPAAFDALKKRATAWLKGRELFVQDLYAGAEPAHQLPVRVITTNAWHALFARNMFIRPTAVQMAKGYQPGFTMLHVPEFQADTATDKTKSGTFVMINLGQKLAMIGGTSYAGEVKKTIFSVMNYYLPQKGVFPMHASANIGQGGDVAIFFGLSGTGKTTLSADSSRTLIGDDEHGWSDDAVFNFEGGCYAKSIRLNPKQEPEIYAAARRFGTVLENVVFDPVTRKVDFDDEKNTENTRACYPVNYIPNASETGIGGLPRNVIMLTCDAYGVLPPVSRLSPEQAMYQFLSGYTAKVAGTEKGITEPQATFSACFGRPFLPLPPEAYAKMLGAKIAKHGVDCWLINTGWTGGGYGVGERIPINVSRAIVNAALSGEMAKGNFVRNEPFGLMIPVKVKGVTDDILHPRRMWKDTAAYDDTAQKLIAHFAENFKKFTGKVPPEVIKGALGV
jgi:phosphoenolpyruvate carboxykinase (ATP)